MKCNPPFGKQRSIVVMTLVMVYLLFSVGILKATHLCKGREASVTYFSAEADPCACSLFAEGEDHCCDNTRDLLKLENSQKTFSFFKLTVPTLSVVGDLYTLPPVTEGTASASVQHFDTAHQPPPKVLFKLYCSFVLYDSSMPA